MTLNLIIKPVSDEVQLKRNPLPRYIAAAQSEHLRLQYALLLSALLSTQSLVSERQSRLMLLLLLALDLEDVRGYLFDQARELNEDGIIQLTRLIHESGFSPFLLVDALVILRLDAPLDAEVAEVVGEISTLLDVSGVVLKKCSGLAVKILGLGSTRNEAIAQEWPGNYRGFNKPTAFVKALGSRTGTKKTMRPESSAQPVKRTSRKINK